MRKPKNILFRKIRFVFRLLEINIAKTQTIQKLQHVI